MSDIGFAKYDGAGNDFVMIEDLDDEHPLSGALVAAVCERHRGVGADGVIRITRADGGADFFMDYWNADGSVAEMCGNGIRCLGKLVFERGFTDRTELQISTRGGLKHLALHVEDGVVVGATVGMGRPAFARAAIPMRGPAWETFLLEPFQVGGASFKASAVSMGNPHLVLFVEDDPDRFPVSTLGPVIEHHELFPERTNVEFVAVEGAELKVRVWERGVGETMACGTGACATLVAANEAGFVPARADLRFPGGTLRVERRDEGEVLLTGPAERAFEGTLDAGWLRARGVG